MFFLAYYKQKIALIHKEKNLIGIEHLRTLNSEAVPLDVFPSLLKGKKGEIVSGLEAKDLILRTLTLKLKSKKEILAALPFQVENLLPYPEEDLVLLPTLYPGKDQTDVLLLATTESAIQQHLDVLNPYGIDPDSISCTPLALVRFANHFFPKYPSLYLCYPEEEGITFVVLHEGRLKAAHFCKAQDSGRMWALLQQKYPSIDHILNFGAKDYPSHLIRLEIANPSLCEYAIAIGLALDAAKNDALTGQFRRHCPSIKIQKKQKKLRLTFALTACISLASLLGLGHHILHRQEQAIVQELNYPANTRLKAAVEDLQRLISQENKAPISLPTIPKASEVLAWLSTHPKLDESCTIKRFSYQMTKQPKLGARIQGYAAKIELELETYDAAVARAFHESLLKDKTLIDQKEGVKWTANQGNYRVIFNLKQRLPR